MFLSKKVRRLLFLASASVSAVLWATTAAAQTITIADEQATGLPFDMTTATSNVTLTIQDRGALASTRAISSSAVEAPVTWTFSAGDAIVQNDGYVVVGAPASFGATGYRDNEAEFRLMGILEFHHKGTILLGGLGTTVSLQPVPHAIDSILIAPSDGIGPRTDRSYDDILSIPGADWIGEGGEVVFDVDLARSQADCARTSGTGDLGAADCLMLEGGTTEGTTYVTINDVFPFDRGRLNPEGIVLVDVAGGASADGHFVIGPNTANYSSMFGGSLDKGLFQYVLYYDEDREQHILQGMLNGSAYQLPMLAGAAHNLWRTSTGSWLERQADLRGDIEGGLAGGIWLRASAEQAGRDVANVSTLGGDTFAFDNTHEQKTYAVTGGVDLMKGMEGDTAYVVGLMAGYAHADIEYDSSPNEQAMDGWTGGVYASFISGGIYLDAAISANNVILDNDTAGFNFFPEGTILSSRLISVGAQVEGGWRFPLESGMFVEPLASVSYVKSRYDDLVIRPYDPDRPGLEVSYDDPTSLRAGVGGRVGIGREFGAVRAEFSLLGRIWNEFEGENGVAIHNLAFPDDPDIRLVDDTSGQINELAVGANVYGPGGVVSGFVNLGGKFGEDYEAQSGSVGVRVAW